MKIKIHIQLEPYNKKKFDYIELEYDSTELERTIYQTVKDIYNGLEFESSEEIESKEAKYASNGKPVKSKDGIILTENEWDKYKSIKDVKKFSDYPWNYDYDKIKEIIS